jgi:hypothetical protein
MVMIILLIVAFVLFMLAALGVSARVNLVAAGLAATVLAQIVAMLLP